MEQKLFSKRKLSKMQIDTKAKDTMTTEKMLLSNLELATNGIVRDVKLQGGSKMKLAKQDKEMILVQGRERKEKIVNVEGDEIDV